MLHQFSRTEMLIGKEGLEKLSKSKVAVFGVGGVGSYAVEALVRAGVGKIIIVDDDCVCLTNLNRQLIATRKTIGKPKVEVMKARILEINPYAEVFAYQKFYLTGDPDHIIHDDCDYIIDAIDTVTGKIGLVMEGIQRNIPVISSMGTGNKLNPTMLQITDIYKTSMCPLAKVMRKELKNRGVKKLKVLFSTEEPLTPVISDSTDCNQGCICPDGSSKKCTIKNQVPGSISFVPPVAGMIIASEVVKDLIGIVKKK